MSPSKPSPDAATDESRLGVIADELYGLRPDEFTKARDEQVRQARADGDKALARDVGALRRPTQSAWLVNMVWRDQPDAVEELLELAVDFDAALAEKAGQKLQALTTRRRELETQLSRRAETLATDAGVAASADTVQEARETLDVALTNPDVAAQVRSGRLVKPASHAGFPPSASTGRGASTGRAPAAASRPKTRAAGKAVRDDGPSGPGAGEADAVVEAEERRREDAEREVADAREALEVAEAELSERAAAAEQTTEEYTVLSENLAELRDRVRALDKQVTAARRAADKADRRRDQAAKAHERARAAVARAEQKLESLPSPEHR